MDGAPKQTVNIFLSGTFCTVLTVTSTCQKSKSFTHSIYFASSMSYTGSELLWLILLTAYAKVTNKNAFCLTKKMQFPTARGQQSIKPWPIYLMSAHFTITSLRFFCQPTWLYQMLWTKLAASLRCSESGELWLAGPNCGWQQCLYRKLWPLRQNLNF